MTQEEKHRKIVLDLTYKGKSAFAITLETDISFKEVTRILRLREEKITRQKILKRKANEANQISS